MHNVLEFVLESTFKVLDLMLKHYFTRCLKKCLMLQAHLKVLVFVLQAPKSVLEPNPGSISETGEALPTKIGAYACNINLYLQEFFESIPTN